MTQGGRRQRCVVARAPWFSAVSARHSPTRPLSSRDARTRSVDRHSRADGVSHRASAGGRRNGSGAGVRGFRRSRCGGRRRGRPRNARRGGHRALLERGARSPRRAPPSPRAARRADRGSFAAERGRRSRARFERGSRPAAGRRIPCRQSRRAEGSNDGVLSPFPTIAAPPPPLAQVSRRSERGGGRRRASNSSNEQAATSPHEPLIVEVRDRHPAANSPHACASGARRRRSRLSRARIAFGVVARASPPLRSRLAPR